MNDWLWQLQLREQDTHLDALESSLSRISELSKHIGHEVEEQSRYVCLKKISFGILGAAEF